MYTLIQESDLGEELLNLSRNNYHWEHEYVWMEGAGHHFVDDRTQSIIFAQSVIIEKLKKDEIIPCSRKSSARPESYSMSLLGEVVRR
jgi:hypothetical protein